MGPQIGTYPAEKTPSRLCLVAFVDAISLYWWDRVFRTRPGFRHSFVVMDDGDETGWILYEWCGQGSQIWHVKNAELPQILGYVKKRNGKMVSYKLNPGKVAGGTWHPPSGFYCVPVIAHLLGLGGWIFTPWQLYQKLLKNGGREIQLENFNGHVQNT